VPEETIAPKGGDQVGRGLLGTIISVLVIIVLVILILQLV